MQHNLMPFGLTFEQPLTKRGIFVEAFFAMKMRHNQQAGPANAPFDKRFKLTPHPLKISRSDIVQGDNEGRATHTFSNHDSSTDPTIQTLAAKMHRKHKERDVGIEQDHGGLIMVDRVKLRFGKIHG